MLIAVKKHIKPEKFAATIVYSSTVDFWKIFPDTVLFYFLSYIAKELNSATVSSIF